MHLLSVNVGREEPILGAKSSGKTGIFKRPVNAPVRITFNGLLDDAISDTKNHGGVDQAVYLFGELGYELSFGAFGENLTVSDLESAGACIGDRFSICPVVLEVTAPRIPCVTLAVRMGDPAFAGRFRRAGRPGVYCRVIQEGEIRVGDRVEAKPYPGERVPAMEVFRTFFEPEPGEAVLRRHLAAPIAVRAREMNERRLARVLARDTKERSMT